MLKEHGKLLLLFREAGEIAGRKKLQKIVYISKKLNYSFQERFNFHFYGPYSEELSLQIEELSNLGFINEVKETKNGYTQYKYQLSEKGREYLALYPVDIGPIGPIAQAINQESARFLELVSTLLYFGHLPKEELVEKILKVKSKQNYTPEEIEQGIVYVEKLETL
jgi:uncharacterized protein YwgA